MKTILLIIFGVISLALNVSFFIWALRRRKDGRRAERVLSPLLFYSIGAFFSVLSVFIPICYIDYDFGDSYTFARPLLLAIHHAIRLFILDVDFGVVTETLSGQNIVLRVCFSLYAASLYLVAPVLTFGNLLSLFNNIWDGLRFKCSKNKKFFILSELNEKSVALAKSIYKAHSGVVIVFASVFEQNDGTDYELLNQAREMHGICLKKDILHLDILSKRGDVEVFLIGSNESDNVSKAVTLTKNLNEKNLKHNIKVFVFASSQAAACIIDSVKYENLLEKYDVLYNMLGRYDYGEKLFKLRRIDEKQQLILNTVPKMRLFELADRNDKTLSVMIVGFDSYSMELFKMLVWYCQFEGYKLQINILDREQSAESIINRACPELLQTNRSEAIGEAHYDIEIYSGVDAMTADLDDLLLYDGYHAEKAAAAKRLKATNLVFVSLGDDDSNIEVSMHLRSLFDRVNGIKAEKKIKWQDEPVEIYSVVFDDQKFQTLCNETMVHETDDCLVNHKEIPYHIHFIGGMSSQFDYQNIYNAQLEKLGYAHHAGWVEIQKKAKPEDAEISQKAKKERRKFEQFEYYRRSSIASKLYEQGIARNPGLRDATTCCGQEKKQTCSCENCLRRMRSEHMRWNAYTRVNGFSYSPVRADRAKLHNDLIDWDKLSAIEKLKD